MKAPFEVWIVETVMPNGKTYIFVQEDDVSAKHFARTAEKNGAKKAHVWMM